MCVVCLQLLGLQLLGLQLLGDLGLGLGGGLQLLCVCVCRTFNTYVCDVYVCE